MKVLLNKNWRGSQRSFILRFRDDVPATDLKKILKGKNSKLTARKLIKKSIAMVEIPPRDRQMAKLIADFTLSDRYTVERLG